MIGCAAQAIDGRIAGISRLHGITGVFEQQSKHLAAESIVVHNQDSQRRSLVSSSAQRVSIERFDVPIPAVNDGKVLPMGQEDEPAQPAS